MIACLPPSFLSLALFHSVLPSSSSAILLFLLAGTLQDLSLARQLVTAPTSRYINGDSISRFIAGFAMHLVTIALSSLFAASSVAALGSPHGLAGRLARSHTSLARDIKASLKRAASPAFAGKKAKKKRATAVTKKMCRVVPSNSLGASIPSSTSPIRHPPTTTTATEHDSGTGAPQPTSTNIPAANSPWKLKVTNVSDSAWRAGPSGSSLTFANLLARQDLLRRLGLLVLF